MGNEAQYSDDISGLWGPDGNGVLEPAPMGARKRSHNGNGNGSAGGVGHRLVALERELRRLADSVESDRDARDDLDGRISLVLERVVALERRMAGLEDSVDARDRRWARPSRLPSRLPPRLRAPRLPKPSSANDRMT